eukprot:5125759-Pyramimonas_sp.AAC.1
MSVTSFGALASASAPVSTGCRAGRNCVTDSPPPPLAPIAALIKYDIPVPILCVHRSTMSVCVCVYIYPTSILNAHGTPVGGVLNADHIDIINFLGCNK